MHKKIRIWALLMVSLMAAACQKDLTLGGLDNVVSSDIPSVTLKQEGETVAVDFASLGDEWQIESGAYASWLTAVRKGALLELTAGANESAEERWAKVVLKTPSGQQILTVTQFGTCLLYTSPSPRDA